MSAKLSCFVNNPGCGFNWRFIAGANHLNMHAFGSAIDVNVGYSDNWHLHKTGASGVVRYRNRIPMALVTPFEKQGFIWGGRWYHYDTMHFEYRHELLLHRP
jgi:peptidoglycan LD-endopeptidase CwlK